MAQGYLRPYRNAQQITPGTDLKSGGGAVFIACTAAGDVVLKLDAGHTLTVPVNVGPTMIDALSVKGVVVAGTTATATVTVLT